MKLLTKRGIPALLLIPAVAGMLLIRISHPGFVHAEGEGAASGKAEVHIAFYNKILVETEIKDAKSAIDYWIKVLADRLNTVVDGRMYNDLDIMREDFRNGLIDWMALAPKDYLDIRNEIELELGPIPLIDGQTMRRYHVIVRSDFPEADLTALQGKRIALTTENEGGRIFLNTFLMQNRMKEIENTFIEIVERRTFAQSILAVFFGQADVCISSDFAFATIAELNPQMQKRLRILATSPSMVHAVSVFRKDLPEDLKIGVTRELLNLENTIEGRQVLTLFKLDRMVPGKESDIESYVLLLERLSELRAGGTGGQISKRLK